MMEMLIRMLRQIRDLLFHQRQTQRQTPKLSALLGTDEALLRFCSIVNWAILIGFILSVSFIWVGWAGPWAMFVIGLVLLPIACWLFYLGFGKVRHKTVRVVEVLGRKILSTYRNDGPCFLTPFLENPVADVSLQKRQWRIFTKDDPEAKTQEMRNSKITISEAYVFVEPILDDDGNVHPEFVYEMVYAYQDIPEVGSVKVQGKGEPAIKKVVCDLSETTIRAICATYFLDEALSGGKIGFNLLGRIKVAAKILLAGHAGDIDIEQEGITAEELNILKQQARGLDEEESASVVHAAVHIRKVEAELEDVHLKFSRVSFAITNFELSKEAARARDLLHTREKEAESADFVARKRGTEIAGTLVHSLAVMYNKEPEEIQQELADPDSEMRGPALKLLQEMMPQQMSLEGKALKHIKVNGAEAFVAELASLFGGAKVVASKKSSLKKDSSDEYKDDD